MPVRLSYNVSSRPQKYTPTDAARDFGMIYYTGDSLYHIFHISRYDSTNDPVTGPGMNNGGAHYFGHITVSKALNDWTELDNIDLRSGGTWRSDFLFAPRIQKTDDGIYWMFFTGISGDPTEISAEGVPTLTYLEGRIEHIGVFSSMTMTDWSPATSEDGYLTHGIDGSWTTLSNSPATNYAGECRDADVEYDDDTDSYYMVISTKVWPLDKMALALASSSTINGTYTWFSDPLGFVDSSSVTGQINGNFVESPYLFKYYPDPSQSDYVWYLFWVSVSGATTNTAIPNGVICASAATIGTGWTYVSRAQSQLIYGLACELVPYPPDVTKTSKLGRRWLSLMIDESGTDPTDGFVCWEFLPTTGKFVHFIP